MQSRRLFRQTISASCLNAIQEKVQLSPKESNHDRQGLPDRQRQAGKRRQGGRHAAPDAGGVPPAPRPAVRFLHSRHGHERDRSGEELPRPQRGTDPRAARRESVPLHRLSQYRQGDQGRLADHEELDMGTAFIGDDLAGAKVNGLPCGWLITDVNGQPMKEPPHPCLAQGKARYVGDHVAMVIAETHQQARDAAELVKVDYEELPAVVRAGEARKKGAPVVHDIAPDNTCYVWGLGDKAAVDKAFAGAAHVTTLEFLNNRLIPNAIEPRAANATYS